MMSFRTDRNNNPAAFTTDVARGVLLAGIEYVQGDSFIAEGKTYHTAKLIGDPIALTIKLIDKIGFYTNPPHARWAYIAIPFRTWGALTFDEKKYVIAFMYGQEGGTALQPLFQ